MADTDLNIVIRAKNLAGRAFSTLTNQMQRVRRLASSVAKSVIKIGAIGTVGIGALATGFFFAAKRAAEFRSGLKEIQTLGVQASIETLEASVVALSRAFGQQQASTTKAFYDAVSAGVGDAAAVTKFLGIAAKAAVAGVSDLATASDALSSVMNAYGIAVENTSVISDAFFGAIRFGKTTFTELASVIGKVAPTAAAAGVSLNDLMLVLSAITKGGISTAEAGTGLKAIFTAILKPTKDAEDAAKRLGLSFDVTALQSKGLVKFLIDVSEATKGSIKHMTGLFPSVEALGPALALAAADARLLRDGIASFEDVTGSAGRAFKIFTRNNPGFVFKQMKQDIAALFLTLGVKVLPAFGPFIKVVRDSAKELEDFINMTDVSGATSGIGDFLERQGLRITDFIAIFRGFLQGDDTQRLGILNKLKEGLKKTFLGAWIYFTSLVKQSATIIFAPLMQSFRIAAGTLLVSLGKDLLVLGATLNLALSAAFGLLKIPFKAFKLDFAKELLKTGAGMLAVAKEIADAGGPTLAGQTKATLERAGKIGKEEREAGAEFIKGGRMITRLLGQELKGGFGPEDEEEFLPPRRSRAQIKATRLAEIRGARNQGKLEILHRQLAQIQQRSTAMAERFFARPEGQRGSSAALFTQSQRGQRVVDQIIKIDAPFNPTFNITLEGGAELSPAQIRNLHDNLLTPAFEKYTLKISKGVREAGSNLATAR